MPIKNTRPRFANGVPLKYFKGTRADLEKISGRKIANTFSSAGQKISIKNAKRLRREIIQRAKILKENSSAIQTVKIGEKGIPLIVRKTKSGRIFVAQQPLLHGITAAGRRKNGEPPHEPFDDLISILKDGFKGAPFGEPNTIIKKGRERLSGMRAESKKADLTNGDSYTIELMPISNPIIYSNQNLFKYYPSKWASVESANPLQVLSVNIILSPKAQKEAILEKKKFYKEQIQKKLGFPVKFVPLVK